MNKENHFRCTPGSKCAELKRIEQVNEELNSIIESSTDGIYVTDGEGNTLRINKAYLGITGLREDEVIGKNVKDLVKQGVFEKSSTIMALEERRAKSLIQTIKGSQKLLCTSNPVCDNEGNLYRVVTSVRDVTKLYKLQSELDEVKKITESYQNEIVELKKKFEPFLEIQRNFSYKSKAMHGVVEKVRKIAGFDTTVLILGETGVGKEVIANLIHKLSNRANSIFATVNCNSIPDSLFEAEFFGYEPGSFTGAKSTGKKGIFEYANGGTVFLDEIGDLPKNMQGKLLRVLQEKEIMRVGGEKTTKIDVRVIAATNKDLKKMAEQGSFREDLYYRLNILPVFIPPLRERNEDIWELSYAFLKEFNEKYCTDKRISGDVIDSFMQYSWPGNVRELRNLIERLVAISNNEIITREDLPHNMFCNVNDQDLSISINKLIPLKKAVETLENALIEKAVNEIGSIRKAAKKLGVHYSTISKKIKKYEQ